MNKLKIDRSILNTAEIARILYRKYALSKVSEVSFWRTGIAGNDIYFIHAGNKRFMLKVYFRQTPYEQIYSSVQIINYLIDRGLPVPQIYSNKEKKQMTTINYPEGKRYAVLFEYIQGVSPDIQNAQDALKIGSLVGRIYHELDLLKMNSQIRSIEETYLIQSAIHQIKKYLPEKVEQIDYFNSIGHTLWTIVQRNIVFNAPHYGLCHGDLHAGNMIKTEQGEIFLFDFDACGYGSRLYDIGICANVDWLGKTLEDVEKDRIVLNNFLAGYHDYSELTEKEMQIFPFMVGIRHFELLGLVLRNCTILEGLHWIENNVQVHYDWFKEWEKTVEIDQFINA